jgi:hypothetical protein
MNLEVIEQILLNCVTYTKKKREESHMKLQEKKTDNMLHTTMITL